MHVIGVVGGIASGKSFVARALCELGAECIDADQLAHQALGLPEVVEAARRRWGDGIFDANGNIDRSALARRVFAGPGCPAEQAAQERKYLESLTHPRVAELAAAQLQELAQRDAPPPAVVLDVPLLFRAGWNEFCNRIVFVDAPRDVRLRRAAARGWNEEEFEAREATQESLNEKRARADVIIANAESPESTRKQVLAFWQSLFR